MCNKFKETMTYKSNQEDKSLDVIHMKPMFSYKRLIQMCLESSAQKRATLVEIYNFISTNFPFYSKDNKKWKNSIRHTLSINPLFERKTVAHRGEYINYWVVNDGRKNPLHLLNQQNPLHKLQIPRTRPKMPSLNSNKFSNALSNCSSKFPILPKQSTSNTTTTDMKEPNSPEDPWIRSSFNLSTSHINSCVGITSPIPIESSASLWSPEIKIDYLSFLKSPANTIHHF